MAQKARSADFSPPLTYLKRLVVRTLVRILDFSPPLTCLKRLVVRTLVRKLAFSPPVGKSEMHPPNSNSVVRY